MLRAIRSLSRTTLLIAAALLSGCEVPAPTASTSEARVALRLLTSATVRSVVVEVSGPGVEPALIVNIPVGADSTASDTLTVPAGSGRRFTATAVDTAGVITHRADTTIALLGGMNPELRLRLDQIDADLGVTISFGGSSISVVDTTLRKLSVGDTVRIAATGQTPAGMVVPAESLTWGSSNPAILMVSNGLVTGLRAGAGAVVVSYRGASARIAVEVDGESPLTSNFTLAPNGVTVLCPAAAVGSTGVLSGQAYTKRDRAGLDALVASGDFTALVTTCTTGIVDMSALFRSRTSFNADISRWDMSAVTTTAEMFDGATAFNRNISAWDVGAVTDASAMFRRAAAFNQDISAWDVRNAVNLAGMFDHAGESSAFNQDLSGWCVSGITVAPTAFDASATSWTRPRPVWGSCSRVSTQQSTTAANPSTLAANGSATSVITVRLKRASGVNLTASAGPLTFDAPTQGSIGPVTDNGNGTYTATYTAGSDAGSVTLRPKIDGGLKALASITLTLTDPASGFYLAPNNVTVMCPLAEVGSTGVVGGISYTKRNRAGLDSLVVAKNFAPLATTCTSGVTDMTLLFYQTTGMNVSIDSWDVSNVTSFREMFHSSTFNQPISNWDVSGATNLASMFLGATSFNQPIGNWNVGNVTNMSLMFAQARAFNQPIGGWNTASALTMAAMFADNPVFNQPLGNWNTARVTSMESMFARALSFNQDITGWNVRSVSNMIGMFEDASSFNRDLSGWCVPEIPGEPIRFALATNAWTQPKPIWGTCPTP